MTQNHPDVNGSGWLVFSVNAHTIVYLISLPRKRHNFTFKCLSVTYSNDICESKPLPRLMNIGTQATPPPVPTLVHLMGWPLWGRGAALSLLLEGQSLGVLVASWSDAGGPGRTVRHPGRLVAASARWASLRSFLVAFCRPGAGAGFTPTSLLCEGSSHRPAPCVQFSERLGGSAPFSRSTGQTPGPVPPACSHGGRGKVRTSELLSTSPVSSRSCFTLLCTTTLAPGARQCPASTRDLLSDAPRRPALRALPRWALGAAQG